MAAAGGAARAAAVSVALGAFRTQSAAWSARRAGLAAGCFGAWPRRLPAARPPLPRGADSGATPRRALGSAAARAVANPYAVLGLSSGTKDEAEVRAAFRRLAKVFHPDVPQTGNSIRFQEVQQAVEQVLGEGSGQLDGFGPASQISLQSIYGGWAANGGKATSCYGGRQNQVPSSAPSPIAEAPSGPGSIGRVDVQLVANRSKDGLRKTASLKSATMTASPETLTKVQQTLAQNSGLPVEAARADTFLMELGFVFEGPGNVGEQRVANAIMALEQELGIELLKVLVNTWVRTDIPDGLRTVRQLADYLESRANL